MNTNGKIVLGIVVLIIIVAGAWYAFAHNGAPAATEPAATTTESMGAMDMGTSSADTQTTSGAATTGTAATVSTGVTVTTGTHKTVTVTYTDQGFSPKSVSLAVGDAVHFVNNSSRSMWVASDPHPSHTGYDGTSLQQHCPTGTSFDECSAAKAGGSYTFTFGKTGSFGYHNHLDPSDRATIVVQ